ncbi:MurR/RpiR family transcriptional regulator [Chelatococcus sp. SYSU_G07232]|uniref:MurR/RpiR family transcriptional regulator n=1 Tax=Chelatococcus albus TaxID=3047466 RepID=A0ABT7AI68_9HYPH|nr:MurR/RpiR family transcriptional regulator [Chelatococcus sp. SYSU_G07232]MDJ1159063.1 MurR/RpiR family transcriptional regulator [Chelatococcus sp. SYSU_G07232]
MPANEAADGAPRDFDSLKALLIERRAELPRRLAQVAEFAIAHPDEVAFGTVASVATQAQVQPSTLIRFAQAVGYAGFSDLQEIFRLRLRERWPDYRERLAVLRASEEGDGIAELFERFTESAALSLMKLRESVRPEDLEAAATLLAQADTIYLVGLRRAFPVSAYLAYAMGKLGLRSVLVDHVAALAGEQLAGARSGDALIAISFTPYTPATVDLANACAGRGIPVVAITDSPFSPLSAAAKVRFEVVEADVGGFRSLAATFCLAMTLAVAVGERRKGE